MIAGLSAFIILQRECNFVTQLKIELILDLRQPKKKERKKLSIAIKCKYFSAGNLFHICRS